jgi:hypothetical protein
MAILFIQLILMYQVESSRQRKTRGALVNAVKKTRDSEAAKADKFPVCDPCLH